MNQTISIISVQYVGFQNKRKIYENHSFFFKATHIFDTEQSKKEINNYKQKRKHFEL
jgi:hypothetical protein